jgi:hypothetical protein
MSFLSKNIILISNNYECKKYINTIIKFTRYAGALFFGASDCASQVMSLFTARDFVSQVLPRNEATALRLKTQLWGSGKNWRASWP